MFIRKKEYQLLVQYREDYFALTDRIKGLIVKFESEEPLDSFLYKQAAKRLSIAYYGLGDK